MKITRFLILGNAVFALLLLFLLRVLPLAVIHDAANGRTLGRCDLDQIHAGLLGELHGIIHRDDAKLLVLLIDEANRRDANSFVGTKVLSDGRSPAFPIGTHVGGAARGRAARITPAFAPAYEYPLGARR